MDNFKVEEEVEVEEESSAIEVKPERKTNSKLTKEEDKIVKDLNIIIPPKVKRLMTKAQLLEYWKAIFIAALTIVIFFLYFENSMINIWALRIIEVLLLVGVILLAEKLYKSFDKAMFLLLLEIIAYIVPLLLCSEMIQGHPVFNGNSLLILSFCYIIYYIFKGVIISRTIYVEYMRSRSDIKEILQDSRKSYI